MKMLNFDVGFMGERFCMNETIRGWHEGAALSRTTKGCYITAQVTLP